MPKPLNIKSPLAAIRSELGMKLEDFADFLDHGAATLKAIEATTHRPMSDKLIDKIHVRLGIPVEMLEKSEWTDADRASIRGVTPAALGHWDDADVWALMPDLLAAYLALHLTGVSGKLAIAALRREIYRTLERWSIDAAVFDEVRSEMGRLLLAVPADRQESDKPAIESARQAVRRSHAFRRVREMEKAASLHRPKEVEHAVKHALSKRRRKRLRPQGIPSAEAFGVPTVAVTGGKRAPKKRRPTKR